MNYVALHAARHNVADIAARTSRHPYVDLAVARLADDAGGAQRFGIWRQGALHRFSRDAAGTIVVDDPDAWGWLGMDFGPWRDAGGATATLADRQAFDATVAGPYPDIFYRVATAFTHAAARFPADILLSMPDDVASYRLRGPRRRRRHPRRRRLPRRAVARVDAVGGRVRQQAAAARRPLRRAGRHVPHVAGRN